MIGHKICFKGVIWKIIPKLFLLPLLIWNTGYSAVGWSLLFQINFKNLDPFFETNLDFWDIFEMEKLLSYNQINK